MMRHGIKIFILLFTIITFTGCATRTPFKKERLHTIAFYNLEKLYDTINDPSATDNNFQPNTPLKWTQERYQKKLDNIASVIKSMGGKNGPTLIGLSEVENKNVVQDLLKTDALANRKYEIIHFDSPDPQGLDLAVLYKPKFFKPTLQENIPIPFQEQSFKSRGILQVVGELQNELITIYVNHWPPNFRNNREGYQRLRTAATTLRQLIDAQLAADNNANIIVMGDFDVEPNSQVLEQVLKATGRPNPAYNQELFNTFYLSYVQDLGSYVNRGKFEMLDQILISKSLLDGNGLQYVRGSATIHKPERIKFLYGKYKNTPKPTFSGTTYFGGFSDHFPVYIKLRKTKQ